ncbi:MAG: hypothetical protein CVV05_09225 [Gammaproteobacteria bacterium HGW-Gammaproteobacteria-1]|jgi:uncharacterized protein|nr:MAG: hypothetical protein CVV05_09225 [Gammaproteobacteria bacterium HGW-Gammaproteobacteria-1]
MHNSLSNVYLLLSQKCNLSCSYCYANGGDFGQESRLMGSRVLRRALERMLPLADEVLVVSFFGGEPLLNFERMQEAVAIGDGLARESGVELRYALTTNGTVVTDEIIAFLKAHVDYVAVSLDGEVRLNDRERRFRNGTRGVHDAVCATLARFREAGIRFGIRGTVTEDGAGMVDATTRYLRGLGADSVRIVPAFHADGWPLPALDVLAESMCALELEALAQVARGEEPVRGESFYKTLACTIGGERRDHPCAAGDAMLAVAVDGGVYPCDHFVGVTDYCMGNVCDESWPGQRFAQVRAKLNGNSVTQRAACRECAVRHVCGGECHAHSLAAHGNIATPSPSHCTLMHRVYSRLTAEVEKLVADETARGRMRDFLGEER